MIACEDAIVLVLKNAPAPQACEIELTRSAGTVAAEDILSDIDMPPFDKAVMDGFAVAASSVGEPPATLKIIGEARAGAPFRGTVKKGEAVCIMTGAPVPEGASAVIKVEETEESDGYVKLKAGVRPGQDVHKKGSYISKGTRVKSKGERVNVSDIAALASVGRGFVKVWRRPAVSVLSTGDELAAASDRPSGARIRDANQPMLISLLARDGIPANGLGIVRDDEGALRTAIKKGLEGDILIISGGVSAGRYDRIPELLAMEGVERVFHKVDIKPGKPLFFGKKGDKMVFGMPGNPMSAFVCYLLFVRPAILKMMGVHDPIQKMERGVLRQDIERSDLRKEFVPVEIFKDDTVGSAPQLTPITSAGSADVFCLGRANGLAVIEAGIPRVAKGTELEFMTW
jgi:molybdopterin molybdotransferase